MKAAATTPGPVVDATNEDDKTCNPLHYTSLYLYHNPFAP